MESMARISREMGLEEANSSKVDKGAIPFLVFCDLYKKDPRCYEIAEMMEVAKKHRKLHDRIRGFIESRPLQ